MPSTCFSLVGHKQWLLSLSQQLGRSLLLPVFSYLFLVSMPLWANDTPLHPAIERLLPAARQGDAVAQTTIGSFYQHGVGVKRNLHKALHWFTLAAEQGDGLAQFNLGLLYQEGQGLERDEQKAIYWLHKVTEQTGRADRFHPLIKGWAQLKLAFIYFAGSSQVRDYQKAREWFEQAAAMNIPMAQEMLGQIYSQGLGVARQPQLAGQWYQRAAHQGSRSAAKALQELTKKTEPLPSAPGQTKAVTHRTEPASSSATPAGNKANSSKAPVAHPALTIQAIPADAQIRILTIRAPYRPGMRLAPGSYRIEVSKAGYQTVKRELVLSNKDRHLRIRLHEQVQEKQPSLTVVPTLHGVMVRILNIDADYRPGISLPPGKYLLELSKPGFKTEQRWVELSEGDLKLEVTLSEMTP